RREKLVTGVQRCALPIFWKPGISKFINIEMPVFQKDATFVLSLALRPDYIGRVIATKPFGPAWVVGVTDKNDRLIARSRDAERFVGQRATEEFIANTKGAEGGFLGITLDGVPVLNAYVTLA